MKGINQNLLSIVIIFSLLFFSCSQGKHQDNVIGHKYNSFYSGKYLDRIAFPVGGIGAGMFCIEGTGGISHMSVRNRPGVFNEPCMFVAMKSGQA